MDRIYFFTKKSILIVLLSLIIVVELLYSQETSDINTKTTDEDTVIAVLPFKSLDNSSRVLPLVAERVFIGKLEGTGVYNVIDSKQLIELLQDKSISIPDPDNRGAVLKAAREAGIEQLVYGTVVKDGSGYKLSTDLIRSSDGTALVSKDVTTVGIEDLDIAAEEITREMSRTILTEEKQQLVDQKFAEEAEDRKQSEKGEDLGSFEELAKTDPEAALEKVAEPAREAIRNKVKEEVKEEARQEVVQEEIQKLYEEEKETNRKKGIRLLQYWSHLGFIGLDYWSSVADMMALHTRMESGKYWGAYMNSLWDGSDPYKLYYQLKSNSDILLISSYFGEGLSLAGKTAANFFYNDANYGIPSGGRAWYATHLTLKAFADAGIYISGLLGYDGSATYNRYQNEVAASPETANDIYEQYRDFYDLYNYSSIATYSFLGLSAAALTVSHLSQGDMEPIARSGKAKFFTLLGQFFSGASSVSVQVALNYRSAMLEQQASQDADPSVPGDVIGLYGSRFWVWSGVSWGLWAVGLASQLYALKLPASTGAGNAPGDESPLAFSIAPVPGGMQAVVGVSW